MKTTYKDMQYHKELDLYITIDHHHDDIQHDNRQQQRLYLMADAMIIPILVPYVEMLDFLVHPVLVLYFFFVVHLEI